MAPSDSNATTQKPAQAERNHKRKRSVEVEATMASNGEAQVEVDMMGPADGASANSGVARRASANTDAPKITHAPSGYTFEAEQDAPGYSWRNKKAQEEEVRAMESVIDFQSTVGGRYAEVALVAPIGTPWKDIR